MSYLPEEPVIKPHNPDADAEALWEVLRNIKKTNSILTNENTPQWFQGNWAEGDVRVEGDKVNWCDTAFCFAGWMSYLDKNVSNVAFFNRRKETYGITNLVSVPKDFINEEMYHRTLRNPNTLSNTNYTANGDKVVPVDRNEVGILLVDEWAKARLGLNELEADLLFFSGNNIEQLEDIVRVITGYTQNMNDRDVSWLTECMINADSLKDYQAQNDEIEDEDY